MLPSVLYLFLTLMCLMTHGSTQDQSDPPPPCNVCCQGMSGIPGVPGTAGIPGTAGTPGPAGRDGRDSSIKGEKGDTGMKGNTGMKGEPVHVRKSAFTAIKTSSQTGDVGDVVTFQETSTNIDTHFNLATNRFTCQISGTYVFTFSIGVLGITDLAIWLVKNGDRVLTAHARTGGIDNDFDQATNAAILDLVVGDQVWLECAHYSGRRIYSDASGYTSFSGFLLYEN